MGCSLPGITRPTGSRRLGLDWQATWGLDKPILEAEQAVSYGIPALRVLLGLLPVPRTALFEELDTSELGASVELQQLLGVEACGLPPGTWGC